MLSPILRRRVPSFCRPPSVARPLRASLGAAALALSVLIGLNGCVVVRTLNPVGERDASVRPNDLVGLWEVRDWPGEGDRNLVFCRATSDTAVVSLCWVQWKPEEERFDMLQSSCRLTRHKGRRYANFEIRSEDRTTTGFTPLEYTLDDGVCRLTNYDFNALKQAVREERLEGDARDHVVTLHGSPEELARMLQSDAASPAWARDRPIVARRVREP